MFVIVGRRGENFVVKDTDDNVKEFWYENDLLSLVKRGISIKGVYSNGVVCIWSKYADFLSSLAYGEPFTIKKPDNSIESVVFSGFDRDRGAFLFVTESSVCGYTDKYLADKNTNLVLSKNNCDLYVIANIIKRCK